MKILIFGVGQYYQNRKQQLFEIASDDEILGFLDNRADELKTCDDFKVYSPSIVQNKNFDCIILMNTYYGEIIEQLIELGVPRERILFWEEYRAKKMRSKMRLYVNTLNIKKKSVLIVTTDLNYNGGSMAIINAAIVLTEKGYNVCLTAASCDEKLRLEIMDYEINLLIYPTLPYISDFERPFIEKFDIVLVNVFQMIKLASDISRYRPTLWWIHESNYESDTVYEYIRYQFSSYDNVSSMSNVNIYAVSDIARSAFETYYPDQVFGVLPYGIPDETHKMGSVIPNDKFVFAIIGRVCKLKSQLIFLEAIKMLSQETLDVCEFWIIGSCVNDSYSEQTQEIADSIPQAKMLGVLTRSELKEAFQKIDCVVCPSMQETMSLAITEGIMYGKICIISDNTGMAKYIKDGENGFICKSGDVVSLADCMKKAFDIRDNSSEMRKNARKLYEEYFSMESFVERLERALLDTEKRWVRTDNEYYLNMDDK